MVITTLADSEAELLERVASLEVDVVRYRELLQVAMASLADMTAKQKGLHDRYARLLDEFRSVRERLTREAVAA